MAILSDWTEICILYFVSVTGRMWAMQYHYFDNPATTMISDRALDAYNSTAREYMANPSAAYLPARESRKKLEECRQRMADVLGPDPSCLYFTSGASEAITIVLTSLLWAKVPGQVITSSIEHEAVLSPLVILREKGWKTETLNAPGGFISPQELEKKITKETRLVAVMAVSNVLGTVQDTKALAEVVRSKEKEYGRSIFFFSDSVQALGKTGLCLSESTVDGASFSAHKIHGPRGVGLLYLRNRNLQVLSQAGGQESGIRGGTENLPAIAGFAEAASELSSDDYEKVRLLNETVRKELEGSKVSILTDGKRCTHYILPVALHLPSQVSVRMLQDKGYLVSAGSACSNNERGKAEAVFRNAGFSKQAGGILRISFSRYNTLEEAQGLARALKEI